MRARIANLESEQSSTKKFSFMETLNSLNERVNTLKKIPNESSYT